MNYIQSSSMVSQMMMPPVSNISKDIVSQNDTDADSSLSIDELGISEDLFNSLDTDGNSLVSSNEIASAIESKLSSFEGAMPTKEEFESLISDLGLEMPEPPSKSDALASDLMSTYDADGDSLLSSSEVSMLSEEEFAALDANSDGSISSDELSSAIDEVATSSAPPPPMGGGAPAGGGTQSASSDEEEYDDADTNQDGIVSYEEKMAALGIDTSTQTSSSENSTESETLQNSVKLLLDTIKHNSQESDNIELSNFKSIMKMMNAQSNNSDLNTYVQNLGTSSSLNAQRYA